MCTRGNVTIVFGFIAPECSRKGRIFRCAIGNIRASRHAMNHDGRRRVCGAWILYCFAQVTNTNCDNVMTWRHSDGGSCR